MKWGINIFYSFRLYKTLSKSRFVNIYKLSIIGMFYKIYSTWLIVWKGFKIS